MKIDFKINRLSCCLLVISLLVCAWIVWNYRDLFYSISKLKVGYVITLLCLFLLVQLVNGYRVFMIVRFFGARIKTFDWICLPYITSYLNYLPVNAGSGATAVFLKKKYNFPYTKFVSMSGALFLLQMFCFSTAGLLLMIFNRIAKGHTNVYAVIALLFIAAVVIGARFVPVGFVKGESRVATWISSALDGFENLRKEKNLIITLMLNSYLQLALMGLTIYFTFISLDLFVNYLDGLLLGIVTSVSKYHFLFPGQLGLRELFIAFATKIIQGSFSDGVIVAVTDRIISGVATIVLGNVFIWAIVYRVRNEARP